MEGDWGGGGRLCAVVAAVVTETENEGEKALGAVARLRGKARKKMGL